MLGKLNLRHAIVVALTLAGSVLALALLLSAPAVSGRNFGDSGGLIARGGGTTIIHGGTGSPEFVPVITTIAFNATRNGNSVTGSFECLAEAPEAKKGSQSAQFTVNAMYVTGQITGASVSGDTATLTGTADVKGLGAGSDVSFTLVVQKGGPGATSVLTVATLPATPFHEILLNGAFEVAGEN